MIFFVLLLIPVVLSVVGFIVLKGVTWKEFLLQVAVQALIAGISAGAVSCANTHDNEVWNGKVTKKQRDTVSCSHSYSCHCKTVCSGSGKNKSCSEKCETCYEHFHDYDWDVYTSLGETIEIDRVDRQGTSEPSRFTAVVIGEPTSHIHSYVNYVKASPDTLFRHQGLKKKYAATLPAYPGHIYDYYRLNRYVTAGASVGDGHEWNDMLSRLNANLGSAKQVNVIVVLTKQPHEWFYALEETWIGGKKNDIVLVTGVDDTGAPTWAEVMAWTTDPLFKIKVRDDLLDEGALSPEKVEGVLSRNITAFHKRKPMSDFEYLKSRGLEDRAQNVA